MKREILFKGKRVDNGEWIEGFLMQENFIRQPFSYKSRYGKRKTLYNQIEVQPDTVCQFTGLLDKNGNKIFEGDKVFIDYNYIGTIIPKLENGKFLPYDYNMSKSEITGNIHD